jgi:hypothetical protein
MFSPSLRAKVCDILKNPIMVFASIELMTTPGSIVTVAFRSCIATGYFLCKTFWK